MVTLPGKASGSALLWRSALRYAMQHRWQTGLNILGILIGVMMVVAVDLANNSARSLRYLHRYAQREHHPPGGGRV